MTNKSFFKGKKVRNWAIGLLVVIIAAFVLLRFNSAGASNAPPESTATVTSVNVAETVEASGSLEAQPSASLTWSASGIVDQIDVEAGEKVKAGDVLMNLKTTSVDASIISAQADLATAQKELDDLLSSSDTDLANAVITLKDAKEAYDKAANYLNYLQKSKKVPQTQTKVFIESRRNSWQYVYKTKTFKGPAPEDWIVEAENDLALKKAEYEDAQSAYDRLKDGPNAQDLLAAQAKVDAAQFTVDSMSILAPFDGEVLYVESQPGDVVDVDTPALNIANLNHLYVETQVDESDIAKIQLGNPITATMDAVEGLDLTGQVIGIDPVGEVDSGLVKYTVRIDLDPVEDGVFLPLSSTVNVVIEVKPAMTSLAVPITAVQNDSKGEYVLVLQADNSTKRVDILSSIIVGDLVVVTGDLKEGDTLTTVQNSSGPGGPFGGGN